jgi:hypothetical protein
MAHLLNRSPPRSPTANVIKPGDKPPPILMEEATIERLLTAVASSSSSSAKAIAEILAKQQAIALQPWIARQARFEVEFVTAKSTDAALLRTSFVDGVKQRLFTPAEVFALTYSVLGSKEDQKMFEWLMIHKRTWQERYEPHNWLMAKLYEDKANFGCPDPTFVVTHGDIIASLNFPLLPPIQELRAVNSQAIAEFRANPKGGATKGRTPRTIPSCIRQEEPEGAGYLAPVGEIDGRHFADLSQVEAAFEAQKRELAQLRNDLREMSRRANGHNNGANNNNYNGYNNGANNNNNYNGYNNGANNNNNYNNNNGANNNNFNGNNGTNNNNTNNGPFFTRGRGGGARGAHRGSAPRGAGEAVESAQSDFRPVLQA